MSQDPSEPAQDKRKLTGPLANVVDVILTGVFWVYMTGVVFTHAPDVPEKWKWIIAGYTAACLAGVFWLTLQGFRVTLVDQIRRKKSGAKN